MGRAERFSRQCLPSIEGLEARQLLTASSSSSAAQRQQMIVTHDLHQFVGDLRDIELHSQATSADYLALRDDARAISGAISTTLPFQTAQNKAAVASIELDRSLLYGSLSDSGWSVVQQRFTSNLNGLNVPQSLIDRSIADMKSAAKDAGVSASLFQTFTDDFNRLQAAEDTLNSLNGSYTGHHNPPPGLYYSQHVRGFFRDWAVQKTTDEAKLASDQSSLSSQANASPTAVATLRRDTSLLISLTSKLPSDSGGTFLDDYAAAFDQGPPTTPSLASLRGQLLSDLGSTLTSARTASVNRLVNDAPTFYQALGSTSAVDTIVEDVRAVVNDGEGSSLNPFRIVINGSNVRATG